jgi:catechol 2,3-dioxygenase-like lactoylglutathione lyase family enzyme
MVTGLPKFNHIHIGVSDLDRSLHFYRDIIGLNVSKITSNMGSISLDVGSIDLDEIPRENLPEFTKCAKDITLAFSTSHIEDYYKTLRNKGIMTIDEPTHRSWGSYNFYLKDPDGYTVEIIEQE